MKLFRLLLFACASMMLYSCSNVMTLTSLELRTLDFKKVDESLVGERTRTIKTKYSFTAIELDLSDSCAIAAGKTVKILAQKAPNFMDLTFKKPKRLLAYRPDVQFLVELPDGKRVWAVLPEASIGLKVLCLETQDTIVIADVTRSSKAVRDSRYNYLYKDKASGKSYTFEELGWGLKGQVYYYQHHLSLQSPSDSGIVSKFAEWQARHPLYRAIQGKEAFYQYPRFSFLNTRWMSNGWHIVFMIVNFLVIIVLYLILLYLIFDALFTKVMKVTIFQIKSLGNGTVLFLSRLLLLALMLSIIWFLAIIDLFTIIFFISSWGGLLDEIEMERCPYCHSVGKLSILGKSDIHTDVHDSKTRTRDVQVDRKHSEYTRSDGTRVHQTTNVMQKQSFRDRITHKRWKENYHCNACGRDITYNKSETDRQEYRVG